MKKLVKIFASFLCVAVMLAPLFAVTACDTDKSLPPLTLDFDNGTKKQEVEVRLFIDGDTTHFNPLKPGNEKWHNYSGCNNSNDFWGAAAPEDSQGYAKARYLAINTPESTGQIEPWGKAASNFTHSKLEKAEAIIIESDDGNWNFDSNGRYLLWVWYIPEGETEFVNLNIEILRSGLAYGSGVDNNRYGKYARQAITLAEEEKLYVFSNEKDPDYAYSDAVTTNLLELRFNSEKYVNKRIRVEGTVVADFNNSSYIEDTFDVEGYGELTVGMAVFHFNNTGQMVLRDVLVVGNRVSVVGILIYSDIVSGYQITDIKEVNLFNDDDPYNCKVIDKVGLDNAYQEVEPATYLANKNVTVEVNKKTSAEEDDVIVPVSLTYQQAILNSSVSFKNLYVYDSYTTKNTSSTNYGAMTLYCRAEDGSEIQIRTTVLYDEDGNKLISFDDNGVPNTGKVYFEGKTINIKGIVEYYDNEDDYGGPVYQIKCHRMDYITIL